MRLWNRSSLRSQSIRSQPVRANASWIYELTDTSLDLNTERIRLYIHTYIHTRARERLCTRIHFSCNRESDISTKSAKFDISSGREVGRKESPLLSVKTPSTRNDKRVFWTFRNHCGIATTDLAWRKKKKKEKKSVKKNKNWFVSVLRRTNAYHSCKLTICEIKAANCLC